MQTLIPPAATARARALGRMGKVVGFGLTVRALMLSAAGLAAAVPAFFHPAWIWVMVGWDAVIVALFVWDGVMLPAPEAIAVTRRFLQSPMLGEGDRD
jgi:hypothetical protein